MKSEGLDLEALSIATQASTARAARVRRASDGRAMSLCFAVLKLTREHTQRPFETVWPASSPHVESGRELCIDDREDVHFRAFLLGGPSARLPAAATTFCDMEFWVRNSSLLPVSVTIDSFDVNPRTGRRWASRSSGASRSWRSQPLWTCRRREIAIIGEARRAPEMDAMKKAAQLVTSSSREPRVLTVRVL